MLSLCSESGCRLKLGYRVFLDLKNNWPPLEIFSNYLSKDILDALECKNLDKSGQC